MLPSNAAPRGLTFARPCNAEQSEFGTGQHSVVVDQSVRAETASEPYRLPVFTGRRIF